MDGQLLIVVVVALSAAFASPAGGALAIVIRPSTLLLSVAVGFAGGALLGAFAFEMVPKALANSSLPVTVAGFVVGFGLVYALDLYVNRGRIAGPEADQKPEVERAHRRFRPRGDRVTVIAGATSVEELIEGLAIGVGAAIDPTVALVTAVAIAIDNVSEALSIGELVRADRDGRHARRILGWTGLIGLSLFSSAMVGWFLLRGLPDAWLGFLFALGAGGMFYLTVSQLIPEAEEHHYQQSSALAVAAGFLTILVLTELV